MQVNPKENLILRIVSGISLTSVLALAFHAGRLENRVTHIEKIAISIEVQQISMAKMEVSLLELKNLLSDVKQSLREHEAESRKFR